MRGKIIVIEGTDCSGKQTQSEKLVEKLKINNIAVECISFPMYDTPTGKIVGGPYLGKPHISETWFKEDPTTVDPKVSSLYYAADRVYNQNKITNLIDKGINVIVDRYTSSNMSHQGGKIINKQERYNFYQWIDELEYKLLGLPKPDVTVLLYLPYEYSLMLKKNREELEDQHERSKEHLVNAESSYLELADIYNYHIINCVKNHQIRSIDDINEELYQIIIAKINK